MKMPMSASQTAAVLTDTSSWRATPLMVSSASQIRRRTALVGRGEPDVAVVDPRRPGDIDAVSFEGQVRGAWCHAEFVGDHGGGHLGEALAEPVAVIELRVAVEPLSGGWGAALDAVVAHGGVHHLWGNAEFVGDLGGGGVFVAGAEPVGVAELCGSPQTA